jgi:hypothetical protein
MMVDVSRAGHTSPPALIGRLRARLNIVHTLAAAGAGFLSAVLWFDLMFDIQLLGHNTEVPESVLTSIAVYYRRVTTDARPMNRLVAAVMLATVAFVVTEVVDHRGPAWATWLSLALIVSAVALAGGRTVPNAVRLGLRRDPGTDQTALARSIFHDHLACLTAIWALLIVQLAWAR